MYSPDKSSGPAAARPARTAPGLLVSLLLYIVMRRDSLLLRFQELARLVQLLELGGVLRRHDTWTDFAQKTLHLSQSVLSIQACVMDGLSGTPRNVHRSDSQLRSLETVSCQSALYDRQSHYRSKLGQAAMFGRIDSR